jgi:hypothetical protein
MDNLKLSVVGDQIEFKLNPDTQLSVSAVDASGKHSGSSYAELTLLLRRLENEEVELETSLRNIKKKKTEITCIMEGSVKK